MVHQRNDGQFVQSVFGYLNHDVNVTRAQTAPRDETAVWLNIATTNIMKTSMNISSDCLILTLWQNSDRDTPGRAAGLADIRAAKLVPPAGVSGARSSICCRRVGGLKFLNRIATASSNQKTRSLVPGPMIKDMKRDLAWTW